MEPSESRTPVLDDRSAACVAWSSSSIRVASVFVIAPRVVPSEVPAVRAQIQICFKRAVGRSVASHEQRLTSRCSGPRPMGPEASLGPARYHVGQEGASFGDDGVSPEELLPEPGQGRARCAAEDRPQPQVRARAPTESVIPPGEGEELTNLARLLTLPPTPPQVQVRRDRPTGAQAQPRERARVPGVPAPPAQRQRRTQPAALHRRGERQIRQPPPNHRRDPRGQQAPVGGVREPARGRRRGRRPAGDDHARGRGIFRGAIAQDRAVPGCQDPGRR